MPHWMRLVAWRMANWKSKKNAFVDKGIPLTRYHRERCER